MTTTQWLVCYDISNDKTRAKVFNTLSDYGTALQYSVFQLPLKKPQQTKLRNELKRLLAQGDSLRWYPVCANCIKHHQQLGAQQDNQHEGYYIY